MAYAAGVRPDSRLTKLLYKLQHTPKTLQQNDKNFSSIKIKAWSKDSFPYQSGGQLEQ